jgi:FkbM family methyltransferase
MFSTSPQSGHLYRFFLRTLPPRLRTSFYHRVLKYQAHRFPALFDAAPLQHARGVRMNLKLTDSFHGEIAWMGTYESDLSAKITSIARETGGLLVDVGANFGYYTLLWCGSGSKNRAVSVEASPLNIPSLQSNIALNGFQSRVTLEPWAASNSEGQITFNLGSTAESGWGGITLLNDETTSPTELHVTVPSRRLDQALPDAEITVLKIDCEGADALVLEGSTQLLAAHRIQHIFFEENLSRQSELGIEQGSARKLLQSFGYQVNPMSSDSGSRNYHATLPS